MGLKAQFDKNGKTRVEVAYESGISFYTIDGHLRSRHAISLETAEKYAAYFKCSREEILSGNPEVQLLKRRR